MANIRSSKKDVRRTTTRTQRNRITKGRIRSLRKKVIAALKAGDSKVSQAAYNEFASAADKAAKTNVLHKNTASRLKSRVAAHFKKAAAK
jgi:small subunit ribosomal protein S20